MIKIKGIQVVTLTTENLEAIFDAMQVIKDYDRSECFKNYYLEVLERLYKEKQRIKLLKESDTPF